MLIIDALFENKQSRQPAAVLDVEPLQLPLLDEVFQLLLLAVANGVSQLQQLPLQVGSSQLRRQLLLDVFAQVPQQLRQRSWLPLQALPLLQVWPLRPISPPLQVSISLLLQLQLALLQVSIFQLLRRLQLLLVLEQVFVSLLLQLRPTLQRVSVSLPLQLLLLRPHDVLFPRR